MFFVGRALGFINFANIDLIVKRFHRLILLLVYECCLLLVMVWLRLVRVHGIDLRRGV